MTSNDGCQAPGISPPQLEAVAGHREANVAAGAARTKWHGIAARSPRR